MRHGQLVGGKTPIAVREVACSWELAPKEIAAELHASQNLVYRAIRLLRDKGYVEDKMPREWNQKIRPTPAGRAALARYSGRSHD